MRSVSDRIEEYFNPGDELYHMLYGKVIFTEIFEDRICFRVPESETNDAFASSVDKDGKLDGMSFPNSSCILWPSENEMFWEFYN